jgi:hypothetical protein
MKECEICVFKFSEIGQKILQYPLFSRLLYDSLSDSDDSVLNKSSTNKRRKIMSSDSESNSDNSSGSCRMSATSRIQERHKCREELFKGLTDSRRHHYLTMNRKLTDSIHTLDQSIFLCHRLNYLK